MKREEPADRTPRPLPREWLPDRQPPEGAPAWHARVERIMAAAGPELRRLGSRRSTAELTGRSRMGSWWKPAAALAAVSTALLLLVGRPAASPEPPPGSIALALVASEGDPVTLWGAFGIQADPVLALIAVQEQADLTRQARPSTIQEEDNR